MRIVVLGAGYAGLTLARQLEGALEPDHELVVVNDSPSHLVQHEIHRAIRRPAIAESVVVPLAEVLERATVRVAQVEGVDPDAKTVSLADPPSAGRAARAYEGDHEAGGKDEDGERAESEETSIEIESEHADSVKEAGDSREKGNGIEDRDETESTLAYDVCAVCLGAETDFQGVPGVAEHATPLKRLRDAERIREDFLSVLPEGGRVVICGAGLSGIQAAGELAALAREEGYDEAELRDVGEALDYATFWLRYDDGGQLVTDALNVDCDDETRHRELVEFLAERAERDVERQLDVAMDHVEHERLDNDAHLYRIDVENHAHRFTYPAPGKTTGKIHDRKVAETGEPVITIGHGPDFAVLRSDGVRLDIPEMVEELKAEIEGGGVGGGGHLVVGSIKFVRGMRVSVIEALVDKMARAELDEELGSSTPVLED